MSYRNIEHTLRMAALSGSDILHAHFQDFKNSGLIETAIKISDNGLPDFVTKADEEVEKRIQEILNRNHPHIPFVGEESGGDLNQTEFFLVDPLDGTSNFKSLNKIFAICAAYIRDGEVKAACVVTSDGLCLSANAESENITYNGMQVLKTNPHASDLEQYQLAAEIAFTKPDEIARLPYILPEMSGLRKSGSTAYDFALMVNGQKSIIWSTGLKPHDIAAPLLIALKAGYAVLNPDGTPASYHSSEIIAGPPSHAERVRQLLYPLKSQLSCALT